jgi:Cu/Zn superoxide dismutase
VDAAGENAFLEGCEVLSHQGLLVPQDVAIDTECVELDVCLVTDVPFDKDEVDACAIGAADCAPCASKALHPSPEAEGAADPSALAAVAIFEPTVSAEAGTVRGAVTIYPSPDDSAAVRVSVELEGLPEGDVFYHVHILGVAPGEGLDATLGHWNPLDSPNMGDACNPQDDAEDCEAGDLSGKHGALAGPAACTTYDDYGIALSGVRSVVGRSIVVHNSEGTRVAGATLEAVGPAGRCDCVAP